MQNQVGEQETSKCMSNSKFIFSNTLYIRIFFAYLPSGISILTIYLSVKTEPKLFIEGQSSREPMPILNLVIDNISKTGSLETSTDKESRQLTSHTILDMR